MLRERGVPGLGLHDLVEDLDDFAAPVAAEARVKLELDVEALRELARQEAEHLSQALRELGTVDLAEDEERLPVRRVLREVVC